MLVGDYFYELFCLLLTYFPNPLKNVEEGALWKEASLHLFRSILGRTPDLHGTLGLISWSGSTMAYTCTVSKSSLLSQRTLESFTLLISASCSRVKDDGQPPFSYQNLSPCLKLWNCFPMRQARVGPTMLPGSGLSVIPADHRSISSGDAYILLNPFTL